VGGVGGGGVCVGGGVVGGGGGEGPGKRIGALNTYEKNTREFSGSYCTFCPRCNLIQICT